MVRDVRRERGAKGRRGTKRGGGSVAWLAAVPEIALVPVLALLSATGCRRTHVDAPTMVPSSDPVSGAVNVPPRLPPTGPVAGTPGRPLPGTSAPPMSPTGSRAPWGGPWPTSWPSSIPWPWGTPPGGAGATLSSECAHYQRCCYALAGIAAAPGLASACGQLNLLASLGSQGEAICVQVNRSMRDAARALPSFPSECR